MRLALHSLVARSTAPVEPWSRVPPADRATVPATALRPFVNAAATSRVR